jgi:hypothetical protein
MTRDEHVYAIQNLINAGAQSDDNRLSNRLVHHFLKVVRSRLIKEKADRQNYIAEDNYQTICMPLIKTSFHDCDCVPNTECLILRTKYKVPRQLYPKLGSTIQAYFFDGKVIGRIDIPSASKLNYSLIEEPKIAFFHHDGYLFITGTLTLKAIQIYGVFEDVDDLAKYTLCDEEGVDVGTPCYNPEEDVFPIDADLIFPMYQMVIAILGVAKQMPEDNENNARATTIVEDKEV